jgi:hypothetical protein
VTQFTTYAQFLAARRIADRARYAANPEHKKARARQWYAENAPAIRARRRARYALEKELAAAPAAARIKQKQRLTGRQQRGTLGLRPR